MPERSRSYKSGPRVPNYSGQFNIRPGQDIIDRFHAISDLTPYSVTALASAALKQVIDRLPPEVLAELDAHTDAKKRGETLEVDINPFVLLQQLDIPVQQRVATAAEREINQAYAEQLIQEAQSSL